jgi:hypothetical protein
VLQGERVRLRAIEREDLPRLAGFWNDLESLALVSTKPVGHKTSDRARDLVFLRVRSTCSAFAATMGGSRPSAGRDTCFLNIVWSQRPKKARNPAAPSHSFFVYERPQVRVGWVR